MLKERLEHSGAIQGQYVQLEFLSLLLNSKRNSNSLQKENASECSIEAFVTADRGRSECLFTKNLKTPSFLFLLAFIISSLVFCVAGSTSIYYSC